MQFLYPSHPLSAHKVDPDYEDEFLAFQQAGQTCLLYSAQDFYMGTLKTNGPLPKDTPLLYRGWMLTPEEYTTLEHAILKRGAHLLVSSEAYLLSHHLPNWYEHVKAWTPETVFCQADDHFEALTAQLQWPSYFVKDHVKSLNTSRGSIAKDAHEIREILTDIEKYRGQIEGGVCLRQVEAFETDTEARFFVFKGKAYAAQGTPPQLLEEIARVHKSPFFSVDLIKNVQQEWRLVEIGDGQVSDKKHWDLEAFVRLFSD